MLYDTHSEHFLSFMVFNTRQERKFVARGGLSREFITLNYKIYG